MSCWSLWEKSSFETVSVGREHDRLSDLSRGVAGEYWGHLGALERLVDFD